MHAHNDALSTRTQDNHTDGGYPANIQTVLTFLETDQVAVAPGWFWAAVIKTYYHTKIRQMDLLALVWDDIDFQRMELRIHHPSESGRVQLIYLDDGMTALFHDLKTRCEAMKGSSVEFTDPVFNVFWFRGCFNKAMTQVQCRAAFQSIQRQTGILLSASLLRKAGGVA